MNCFKNQKKEQLIKKTMIKYTICNICLSEFNKNDKVKILNCGHIYHTSCIKEWFKRKKICPICQ